MKPFPWIRTHDGLDGLFLGIFLTTMVYLVAILASIGITVALGCCHRPPSPPAAAKNCPAACERMRAMHCPIGDPTPRGVSCEDVCRSAETGGSDWLACVAPAASCAAVESCGR